MRVTVIRAYGPYRRGAEINPPDGLGNLLIRRGLVAAISTEPVASESALVADEPEAKTAPKPQPRRK